MPQSSRHTPQAEVPSVTSYGQVIEYIQGTTAHSSMPVSNGQSLEGTIAKMYILPYTDRLYLASYTHAPDENTPFPYPPRATRSPSKRSSKAQSGPQAVISEVPRAQPYYFSIDRSLLYNAFHADFGPLHIGHLYRFAVTLHDVLGHPENENRAVVFWSSADSRSEHTALSEQHVEMRVLTPVLRSCKCSLYTSNLHGADSELASTSGFSANIADGSAMYAIP